MCGIHLIIAKKNNNHNCEAALQRMMQASAFRGPDATNVIIWQDVHQQVYMGGQRLKITDLNDRANQPMVSSDERYALLYNGELYNFYELRNQLITRGETFTTYSDTEVVLKKLVRQGEAALAHFEGMFALAFYDRQEERLLIARDSFGIKPLYYAENEQFFLVSSSSHSLATSGLVSTDLDPSQVDHYFYFRYPQKGYTLYHQIRSLSEGQYLVQAHQKPLETSAFISSEVEKRHSKPNENEILETTSELLKDAVLRQVAADVPTGLFLSGGVDSTLILALLKESAAPPTATFSVINDAQEKQFGTEDYRYAQRAAQQFGGYHRELPLSLSLFEQNFEGFIQRMDQPVGDSASMMTYLLSREASNYVKVVLSGAGADEFFGGYNRHEAYYRYLKHHSLFGSLAGLGKKVAKYLPTGQPHPFRKSFRLFSKFAQSISADPEVTFLQFIGLPSLSGKTFSENAGQPAAASQEYFVEKYLSFALEHDQQNYLVEDVLQVSDAGSMAHSLELRVPYLDIPVVRYAQSLPATFLLKHGKKWILKQLLDQRGGKLFTRRKKEGFGLPFGHWLKDDSSKIIPQYLEDSQLPIYQFISFNHIRQLLKSHRSGHDDYSAELWSVMLLSAWMLNRDL